jgi:lysophospholipase L1-like esterase
MIDATPSTPPAAGPRGAAEPARPRTSGAWLAAASLLASLALVEGMLRLARPLPDPYADLKWASDLTWPGTAYVPSAYPPHYHRTVHAELGLPGMDARPRRFTLNNLGFRGDSLAVPKPAGEVRVFMVGGSTTECVFLDDREAVTARLQAYLRQALPGVDVRVYGAGKSGDRSWDHVAMTAHRIAHLQPDVIVVFSGINDLSASIAGRDYLMRTDPHVLPPATVLKMAASELQLFRLAHAAFGAKGEDEGMTSRYGTLAREAAARPLRPFPRRPDPAPFAENLETLAGIARAHGARLVLMTQATTWNSADPRTRPWHWMLGRGDRYDERELDAAMRRYNEATRGVGARLGVPVFDLERALPKSADYLYDDVHFNVRGADTAARMLAAFMVRQGVVQPAADSAVARGGRR